MDEPAQRYRRNPNLCRACAGLSEEILESSVEEFAHLLQRQAAQKDRLPNPKEEKRRA